MTDKWLRLGNPWEIARPDASYLVNLGGRTEQYDGRRGQATACAGSRSAVVKGVPYDTPILGYRVNTCNTLRLWSAEAVESFDFAAFNRGDYYGAVEEKMVSENITKVLYPNDEPDAGQAAAPPAAVLLRRRCSLQDMLRIHTVRAGLPLERFHDKWAIQLNDTHPSIAVAELMRLLVDEHRLDLGRGLEHHRQRPSPTPTTRCCPRRWRRWPLGCSATLLPRHLEIIYEINGRFLDEVRAAFPGDDERGSRGCRSSTRTATSSVRMAHLATVGSHARQRRRRAALRVC